MLRCACAAPFRHHQLLVTLRLCGVALGTKLPSAANLSTTWASLPQTARSEHLHRCRTCTESLMLRTLMFASANMHWQQFLSVAAGQQCGLNPVQPGKLTWSCGSTFRHSRRPIPYACDLLYQSSLLWFNPCTPTGPPTCNTNVHSGNSLCTLRQ